MGWMPGADLLTDSQLRKVTARCAADYERDGGGLFFVRAFSSGEGHPAPLGDGDGGGGGGGVPSS